MISTASSKTRYLINTLSLVLILSQTACAVSKMEAAGQKSDEVARHVDVGDYVRVWTKDDTMREFEVTRLTSTSISGPEGEVLFEDIIRVDVREVDEWRTAAAYTAGTLGAAAVVLIVLIAAGVIPLFAGF